MSNSDFRSQFGVLTGSKDPFPWQTRLTRTLVKGEVPQRCAVPTGLGKTNVIAAWLCALGDALQRKGAPVPRRLVYVVDRRTIVDQATAEVVKMRERLRNAEDGSSLATLRSTLQGASAVPDLAGLTISTLRGRFADNHEWDIDASRPAVIVGTVDMIGSRLLFAGYGGVGRHRRSLHAGLLAQDALIVIDEAHLSPAFAQTLFALREQLRGRPLLRPFDLMLLTATQPHSAAMAASAVPDIRIDESDLEVEEVRNRLRAEKALCFVAPDDAVGGAKAKTDSDVLAGRMAAEAVRLAGRDRAVSIFANTVELANRIHAALKSEPHRIAESQVLVLTGEMRGQERNVLVQTENFLLFQKRRRERDRDSLTQPRFLITTAAGEVGVNFDADHAVCDLVPLERMAQRLGRVNRFGDGGARVSVVLSMNAAALRNHVGELERLLAAWVGAEGDARKRLEKRIFEMEKVLSRYAGRALLRLEALPAIVGDECARMASPEALSALCREPGAAEAYSPSSEPPPLDAARLDDWALTSLHPTDFPRPQVTYWLRGLTPDDTVTTQLVWRKDLGTARDELDAATMAQAIPLRPEEIAKVATYRAAKLLIDVAKAHPESIAARLTASGEWTAQPLKALLNEHEDVARLIAFSTVILPAEVGGLNKQGLPDRSAPGPVLDAVERDRYRRFRIRWVDDEWLAEDLFADDDVEVLASGATVEEISRPLAHECGQGFKRVHVSGDPDFTKTQPRIVYFAKSGARVETSGSADIASLQRKDVLLNEHSKSAEYFARLLAERLALPQNLAEAVVLAAARHDLGKDRPQWQRAIRNAGPEPLAKSARTGFDRAASGGYRHEFGSMLQAAEDPAVNAHPERDLILHLIAAHHGHARPGFAKVAYDCPRRLLRQCAQAADEAQERFIALQQRFGWWQLAWLEALVKSADALASAASDRDPSEP